ncbi:MAG TPA: pitrilysin family protein [Casimicrobiaceae bacterium]|nr:pitrilysin family protein [Casimicrobiaceae bacterium]
MKNVWWTRARAAGAMLLLLFCVMQQAASAPAVTVPPLEFRERVLANGLRVVTLEDHTSPTVSVQVWYEVGGKNDPPGRSGFAHLFEHLMFKGTKYLKAEQMDRLTEDVGGMNNAATREDVTHYFEVVPSNHLERILWAEAERMGNLDVADENFKSERAVVEEEYRTRVLASPYGRFYESFSPRSYAVHPYKRGVIGNIDELEAASLDDVRDFHRTYYRPDNAILIVAGDFDPAQLDAWIDKYFAPIAKPATPIPRVSATEPPRAREARYRETGPNVPLPAVALTWAAPSARSPDAAALNVAAALLGNGESSRLNQALVYRAQMAQEISFSADLRVDPGLLVAYAVAAKGTSPDALLKALRSEIVRLAQKPVPEAELAKVKIQLLTQALDGRQTPMGKADALGEAIIYRGDPAYANKELDELMAVTASDVQRVLRKYILDAKEVTIEYVEAGAKKS